MKFKYFDHTADVCFESYGKTLEEAFTNSALAAFNIITDITKIKQLKKQEISVKAIKLESLLFDFLDELIFLMDTKHIIFSKFDDMRIGKKEGTYVLTCIAHGDSIDNYERHGDIKAPTYNEMSIRETEKGFIIRAVVDI
jgi:SHS2 domain-containing protein